MILVHCDSEGCEAAVPLAMADTSEFVSLAQGGKTADACSVVCAAAIIAKLVEERGGRRGSNESPIYSV